MTNPTYDDRLFIELQFRYMKIPSSNLGRTCCVQKLFSPCSAKRRASDKDLPVPNMFSPFSAKRRTSDKDLPSISETKTKGVNSWIRKCSKVKILPKKWVQPIVKRDWRFSYKFYLYLDFGGKCIKVKENQFVWRTLRFSFPWCSSQLQIWEQTR